MKKKEFAKFPVPEPPRNEDKDLRYLLTAQRQIIEETDTLIVNIFNRAKDDSLHGAIRIFCQPTDDITQDLVTGKWRTGAIGHVIGYSNIYSHPFKICIADSDKERIEHYFADCKVKIPKHLSSEVEVITNEDIVEQIAFYQSVNRERKLAKKHEKIQREIDCQMERFRGLPDDYEEFVDRKVMKADNYIVYSLKKKRAYCTYCHTDFEIDGAKYIHHGTIYGEKRAKHGQEVFCPICKNAEIYLSDGMGKKSRFAIRWSAKIDKSGNDILIRYLRHTRDFSDAYKPKTETREILRMVLTAEESTYYEFYDDGSKWGYMRGRGYYWLAESAWTTPCGCVVYDKDLKESLRGTFAEYSAFDIFNAKVISHYDYDGVGLFFNIYREKSYIEKFLKVGFYELAHYAYAYRAQQFKNARSIVDVLGIDRKYYKYLKDLQNPSIDEVELLQAVPNLTQDEFLELLKVTPAVREECAKARRFTTIHKVVRYLCENLEKYRYKDYFEYLEWTERLGYDMKNEFNLFPKNFSKAHDRRYMELTAEFDQVMKEEAEQFEIEWDGVAQVEKEGLIIRLPYSTEEIRHEGECLHHCVATYIDRVRAGETSIFFIRQKSEPDKPFYTLEWRDNRVIQCRGIHNCDMTSSVRAFVKFFEQEMKGKIEKPKEVAYA